MKPLFIIIFLLYSSVLYCQDFESLKKASFSNPDSVIELATYRLNHEELSDSVRSCYLLIIGIAHRNAGSFEKGLLYSDSALQSEHVNIRANAYQNTGVCYRYLGSYEKSIDANLKAMRIYDSLGYRKEIGIVLNSLGVVNMKMQDFNGALHYYMQAWALAVELEDLENEGNVVNNIAIVYANLGKLDSSELFFRKGYEIEVAKDNLRGISAGLNNIGAVKYYKGNLDSAIIYFHRSLQIDKKIGDKQGIPAVMNNIAEVAIENRNFELAKSYLDSSIMMSKEVGSLRDLENAYLNLAGMYQTQEKFEDAFEHILISNAYRDSLISEEKSMAVVELETKYETEKKEQQIALQKAEIAEHEALNKLNLVVIIGLILSVISLIIILVLVRSRSRKKQALLIQEAELKLREAQIEAAISSQEQERTRVAQDLHDGFGQMISLLNLNLKSLEKEGSDKEQVFEQSSQVLDDMYQELKGICFNLMPQTLINNGITAAINEFAARVNQTDKLTIETDFFGLEERLTEVQEISLYRITQEWVNNMLKYSDADRVNIQITKDEQEITLMIEDNGSGFDLEILKSGKGNGWRNMNSRTNLMKGELEVDTQPGMKGNTLIVNAPTVQINTEEKALELSE